tara:strand:+ start:360 stop:545 length:186 start_codon:yes stop_codon:yes gene_type:complete
MAKKCVICKDEIKPDSGGWAEGHNAEPVKSGRCCGDCNSYVVTPARINEYINRKEQDNGTV